MYKLIKIVFLRLLPIERYCYGKLISYERRTTTLQGTSYIYALSVSVLSFFDMVWFPSNIYLFLLSLSLPSIFISYIYGDFTIDQNKIERQSSTSSHPILTTLKKVQYTLTKMIVLCQNKLIVLDFDISQRQQQAQQLQQQQLLIG